MTRFLAEPLLHFVLLGAALFGFYAVRNHTSASAPHEILVTAGHVDHLATAFSRVWQRPPTPQELKGLIDDYVQEEVLSREAIKLGLDQEDTIIRRRLRQKMEFIAEDFAASNDPTEADLQEFYREHADDFRMEARFSFLQVFLSLERGEQLRRDAAALLDALAVADPGTAPAVFGDRTLLPGEFVDEPQSGVVAQFGEGFVERLNDVSIGAWSGPFRSAYGDHLVLVTDRNMGTIPPFEEVRDRVKRELLADRRRRVNLDFLGALLDKYEVTVEWPGGSRKADEQTASVVP